jgi:hypothetical protein
MMLPLISQARRAAELFAALACAALGLHLMIVAIGEAQQRHRPPRVLPVTPAPDPELAPVASAALPTVRRTRPPVEYGPPLRLTLSVTVGPPRSEVYVNGSRLGDSPYLGDFSCKSGERLQIEVVPEKGALITRTATCEGSLLSVR